jgi:hypothetical protein
MKRTAPQVEVGTAEYTILERAYNLIEHMQQLRGSKDREMIRRTAGLIDHDIEGLRDMLRIVKAEMKDVRGAEPISRQTDVEQQQQS